MATVRAKSSTPSNKPVPEGFAKPDLASPIDVAQVVSRLSPNIRIRGMFLQSIVALGDKQGKVVAKGPYIAFKDYHVEEHVRVLCAAADVLYPALPRRQAFVLLGRSAYVAMTESLIGRVVFGVLGRDIARITRLVGKAYEIAGSGVTATLVAMGPDWSHVRIDGALGLVDTYHVGAFEGVLDACGLDGEVFVKLHDDGGELFTKWWPKNA